MGVLGRFFFLIHPPFFFGAVEDEAAFEKEIRRTESSELQARAMQAAMAAVQQVLGGNPEPKAEAKAKSSRKRKWTNVSLIHYFF